MNNIDKTIQEIAEIIGYGINFIQDDLNPIALGYEPNARNISYNKCRVEAIGHMLSCLLVNKLAINDGVETMVGVKMIEDFPKKEILVKRIKKFIKNYR